MSNNVEIRKTTDIAIFVRNHLDYLNAAVTRNKKDPEKPTTFRARTAWKSALLALQAHGTLPIYFAPVAGSGNVEFSAILHHIKLDPLRGDDETETYLGFALTDHEVDETSNEGLWEQFGKRVKTLYVITHCKPISPFPFTDLIKLSNGSHISPDYGYSYCIVHQNTAAPGEDFLKGPDDVGNPDLYYEGVSRSVTVNVYERSRSARKKCIEHYGLDCTICGFNFEKIYGDAGKGIIHVHHIKPLSEIDQKYKVDPIRDLRPVCPNCHAVIHSGTDQLTIDQIRKILPASSSNSNKLDIE